MSVMNAKPSVDDLLARARAMLPALRERAQECEKLRRLPGATAHAFADAGFFRVLQPARYGGLELDYGTHMRLAIELGQACASSAWVMSVIASHAWILGMFPQAAQEEVWSDDAGALIATSFLPVAPKVEPAGDGFRLSGRWKFSSGVDLCRWALLMVPVPGADAPDLRFALVDLKQAAVEDTWFVTGLAGTGSNDIVVDNVLVAPHRALSVTGLKGGPTPGSAANPGYLYRLPLWAIFPFTLIGVAIGAARGALDAVVAGLSERKSVTQVKLAEQQSVQMRVARVAALVNAAEASMLHRVDTLNRDARGGRQYETLERVRYKLDLGLAADLCVQAMETLLPLLGGRGLISTDPVQRAWRDVHAVAQHLGLVWDVQAGLYGPVKLGLPCPDPKI